MAALPDKYNPFVKNNIYEKLKLAPDATQEEIQATVSKLSLDDLPEEEQKAEREYLKKSLTALKRNFTRVGINALILEKIDNNLIESYAKKLPNLKSDGVKLPPIGLTQVLFEGQDVEIAEADFTTLNRDTSFEIDMEAVRELLHQKRKIDKHVIFES